MPASRRIAATALLSATVLALPAAGTAAADTNKSEQKSALSGPTAALLSPATGPSDNRQANGQLMDKAHATNWSLIDYAGTDEQTLEYIRAGVDFAAKQTAALDF
ncbi:hypothetical protein ABZ626_37840 [Streptomyces longispororuber]|uniref:hypothetical protein n=1 Tax=Streptomyces longispororuber TaxID=68230 RepID=UPI0034094ABF